MPGISWTGKGKISCNGYPGENETSVAVLFFTFMMFTVAQKFKHVVFESRN